MAIRQYGRSAAAVIACAALLGGCAAMERATLREEARQLAWTGPGPGPCMFGGVTQRAVEHCARINFGVEGVLMAVNDKVRGRFSDRDPAEQVEALRGELARHKDLLTEPVYTCPPPFGESGDCHVSLLVTTGEGERFVVDNGAIVSDTVGVDGVASFAAFEEVVEGAIWVGRPPTADEVGAAMRRVAR